MGEENLSQIPGFSIDGETGELNELSFKKSQGRGNYIISSYSQKTIDTVRLLTAPLGVRVLCHITGGRKIVRGNNPGSDIVLPNGNNMEAKIGRIGNSAVIKRNQLELLKEDDYYGVVYYKTTNNKPPSFFLEQNPKNPLTYLKRNIFLKAAFLLPKPVVVHYYNTSDLVEGIISTTGIRHKPLAYTRALGLFEEVNSDYKREKTSIVYGRHNIEVFSIQKK